MAIKRCWKPVDMALAASTKRGHFRRADIFDAEMISYMKDKHKNEAYKQDGDRMTRGTRRCRG